MRFQEYRNPNAVVEAIQQTDGMWLVTRLAPVTTMMSTPEFHERYEPAGPLCPPRCAVTVIVLLPDGFYEASLDMPMPPFLYLTLTFGDWSFEIEHVEYDHESGAFLVQHDPTLYGPDLQGEADWLRGQLMAHGFSYREPSYGRSCRVCGCTDDRACVDPVTGEPCHWVEDDLCSACAEREYVEQLERDPFVRKLRKGWCPHPCGTLLPSVDDCRRCWREALDREGK